MNNSSSRKSMTGLSQSVNATQFDIDGNINMEGYKLYNLGAGVNAADSITLSQLTALGALYLPLAGGTMGGEINMNSNKITSLSNGTLSSDAINLSQLTAEAALYLPLAGGTMSGDILMGNKDIKNIKELNLLYSSGGAATFGDIWGVNNFQQEENGYVALNQTYNAIPGTLTGGYKFPQADPTANQIIYCSDATSSPKTLSFTDIDTIGDGRYLQLTGGTMSGNINMGTKTLTNIGTGSGGYSLPASGNLSRYVLRVSAGDITQLEFANPTDIEDNVWRFITGTGYFDTAVLRGTQTNTAVSIGKDTAALATSQLVRLYIYGDTTPVITRTELINSLSTGNIQLDLVGNTSYGQLRTDNTAGAGSTAILFLTGRGGVKTQHIKAADGTTLNINTTTETSFNTESGISIGSGMGTTEPESSIVAAGSVKITAPTQHGVHMGEISSYAVVNLVETAGGAVHFNNPDDTANSGNFNAEILYTESNNVLNITNRATGETTNKTWFSGNGVVVDNVFQGYNWYAGEGADWAYTLRRSSGSWAAPAYQKLMIAFQTGIEYIVNTALGSHNFFFSGFGTENSGTPDLTFGKTTHVKASNGYIESSFHPMIYASINFNSAGTKIKGRNCSSTRISTGYYRIDFDAAASNANYVAIATATAGGRAAINAKTTTTCEVVTTTATSGGAVLADHGVNFIMVDH